MRLVLAYQTFASLGGSATYLLTVAEHLQRLGHEVTIFTHEPGEMAEIAAERALRVVASAAELPPECDAILAQDGGTAYLMADRYPQAPLVFVCHSVESASSQPPQLPETCQAVIVLNDRVRARVDARGWVPEVVRLRQPVDLARFGPLGVGRERPRKALVLGNWLRGKHYARVARACTELGWEVEHVGRHGHASPHPERHIADADLVVGQGRCVVEAMAGRRAAFVLGLVGGDGWVTPESYAVLEADGFAGSATDRLLSAGSLRDELAAWHPEMGTVNHEIATAGHDAGDHCTELVSLFDRLGGPRRAPAPAEELARLTRLEWAAHGRAAAAAAESKTAAGQAELVRRERDALAQEVERLRRERAEFETTRRYRLAKALAAPLDAVRRLRRNGVRSEAARDRSD